MISTKKVTEIMFIALTVMVLASGISSAATDIEYKKGTHVKQALEVLNVKEIQFIAECDGVMTISNSENRIDILSSCRPRNLYVQFIVPNDRAVYQTKDTGGKKIALRILQKRIAVSGDGKYNVILTKPESTGRFEFFGDLLNQNDDFTIENAADQTLKANIQTISIDTIFQKDEQLYNFLIATNLSATDQKIFNRFKNAMEVTGLAGVSNQIFALFDDLKNTVNSIIGGK